MTSAANVTVVPVSGFPEADALDGTEIVPLVQDGLSKRTTAQDIADLGGGGGGVDALTAGNGIELTEAPAGTFDIALADVLEATVLGRATGDGDGPVESLDEIQLGDLVWEDFGNDDTRRFDNNIGYLTLPVVGIANGPVPAVSRGKGLVKTTAGTVTLTLPNPAGSYPASFIITLACTHASGQIDINTDAGATLICMNDGSTGPKSIIGIGIATLWLIQQTPSVWVIHGSAALQ